MAVAPAAHQGGVNVSVRLSLLVHLSLHVQYDAFCNRGCVRAIVRVRGVRPWRRDLMLMLMIWDKFGGFAGFFVRVDAEKCARSPV